VKLLLLVGVFVAVTGWAFMLGAGNLGIHLGYGESVLTAILVRIALSNGYDGISSRARSR
jgi:hypothetical protein